MMSLAGIIISIYGTYTVLPGAGQNNRELFFSGRRSGLGKNIQVSGPAAAYRAWYTALCGRLGLAVFSSAHVTRVSSSRSGPSEKQNGPVAARGLAYYTIVYYRVTLQSNPFSTTTADRFSGARVKARVLILPRVITHARPYYRYIVWRPRHRGVVGIMRRGRY